MSLADLEWRVIGEETRPGPMTMALEAAAAETVAAGGPATVRVYTWPDTLSLGYGQDQTRSTGRSASARILG